jgi:hypothetical protein
MSSLRPDARATWSAYRLPVAQSVASKPECEPLANAEGFSASHVSKAIRASSIQASSSF